MDWIVLRLNEISTYLMSQLRINLLSLDNSNISVQILIIHFVVGMILLRYGLASSTYVGPSQNHSSMWSRSLTAMFPRKHYFSQSSIKDLQIFLFFLMFFAPISIYIFPINSFYEIQTAVGRNLTIILHHIFEIKTLPNYSVSQRFGIDLIYTITTYFAYDFGYYVGHRLQHRNKYLWEFHKVHHSSEALTPLSNYRSHLTNFLNVGTGALFVGIFDAFLFLFYKTPPGYVAISGILIFDVYVFAHANLSHSHLWISFGKYEKFFYSPAMHLIHHSKNPQHYDKNFASLFSIWDRYFGTAVLTEKTPPPNFAVGLEDDFDWNRESISRVLWRPIRQCIFHLTNKSKVIDIKDEPSKDKVA
jgi:sterol desaturase/sphingolipid hydroxylase (fatty acid hydroxylase superfamily)